MNFPQCLDCFEIWNLVKTKVEYLQSSKSIVSPNYKILAGSEKKRNYKNKLLRFIIHHSNKIHFPFPTQSERPQ